ncbi:trypco2 family protein [Kitasatospora sp. NPDC057541]|uniref:trypco2 family protein n=1 Tax=unclassified Kitasatospora TaxID=2633591 RepID=UPI00369842B5
MTEIGLAQAIEQLKTELQQAITANEPGSLQFPVKGVEIELQVGVTKEGGANGGIKLHVLSLGASGKYAKESVQTVKLSLGAPVTATGEPVKVSERAKTLPK